MRFDFAPTITETERAAFLASPKVERAARNAKAVGATTGYVAAVHVWGTSLGFADIDFKGCTRADGGPAPGTVFVRGDAVAVLPILKAPTRGGGERLYAVITHQTRAATGKKDFAEIPAGMMDGGGNFKSKAIDELNEEVGADIGIRHEDLVHLESVYPSPGACDEKIDIFYAEVPVSAELIRTLQGRRAGLVDESECITCEVVPLEDLPRAAPEDMKARIAYYAYAARKGFVPGPRPDTGAVYTATVAGYAPTVHRTREGAEGWLCERVRDLSGLNNDTFQHVCGDGLVGASRWLDGQGLGAEIARTAIDPRPGDVPAGQVARYGARVRHDDTPAPAMPR